MTTTGATNNQYLAALSEGPAYFILRRLHSLTGIIFGGYLVVHLIVNATIAQGGQVYQNQVDKIHNLPFLPAIEWTFIYLPILFHMLYGTWIIVTGRPNNASYPYAKNWFYLLQRITAVYIAGFIAFHVLSLKYGLFGLQLRFQPENALQTVAAHFHYSPILSWIIYPLGILASTYHTANGFWTAGITWGLTVSAGAQRRWGYACGVFFVALSIAGIVALVAATALPITK